MTGSEFNRILQFHAGQLGFELDQSKLDKFSLFTELLLSWNQRVHLVSQKDAHPVRIARQIIDSLLPVFHFQIPQNSKVLDLGSGAGFPAVPIKIVRPDLEVVLAESIQKKSRYLKIVIEELKLDRMHLLADRAQHLDSQYESYFDYAFAKASGNLGKTWAEVFPFLKTGAKLVAYKGREVQKEIERAGKLFKKLPGGVDRIIEIDIGELDLGGYLVSVRKV